MASTSDDQSVTEDWMRTLFPEKPSEKLQCWTKILQEEEICTVSAMRALRAEDWQQLGLPLAVRSVLQKYVEELPSISKINTSGPLVVGDTRPITQLDIIVMDVSCSMKAKSAIDRLKTREDISKIFFLTLIDKLIGFELPHVVGLISFGQNIYPIGEMTRDFDRFQDELGRLDANEGATKLWDSIMEAANMLCLYEKENSDKLATEYSRRIFVLTDGEDNSSQCQPWELASVLQQRKIFLDAIPVAGPNQKLQAVSRASGGQAVCVTSEEQGLALFENEALLAVARREKEDAPPAINNLSDFMKLLSDSKQDLVTEVKAYVPAAARGPTMSTEEALVSLEKKIAEAPAVGGASLKRILKELNDVRISS